MEKRGPVFEKSRSVDNVYNMRLTALLRELVREGGFKGAAKALDLDQRTVAAAYRRGVLSRRVRSALERGLQEGRARLRRCSGSATTGSRSGCRTWRAAWRPGPAGSRSWRRA